MDLSSSQKGSSSLHGFKFGALLITLGIIYGDIGTSPLYVMNAIISESGGIVKDYLVYGGLSCVIWTLTLQTTIKYIVFTLRADNNGEGGIFSLYALVRRYKKWLFVPAIIGGCTLLADGFITPPISVASAIEGLRIINPNIDTVPIVLAIITLLFMLQRYGTAIVGKAFGPIMFLWFAMIATLGFVQIMEAPMVLKAFNPYYAFDLIVNHNGFWLLGAVFLCTTGAEALYSDLGHCGRINIRITWVYVKACLILNYLGQGSWLLQHPGQLEGRVFYNTMPEWFLPSGIIIATAAAIIASQALITGSFTLISEAVRLNFWPKVGIKYPTLQRGQLYVPSINWILWIGCCSVVLYFQESGEMEAAYGLAITLTMLMTTILLSFYLYTHRYNKGLIFGLMLMFLGLELTFLVANLNKFSHGGWVTLLIGSFLLSTMYIWNKAREIQRRYIHYNDIEKYLPMIEALHADEDIPRYAGNLVFLTNSNQPNLIENKVLNSIFKKRPKRADVYWLLHVDVTDQPYTTEYRVHHIIPGKCIRIDFRLGFRIEPRLNMYFRRVIDDLVKNKEVEINSRYDSLKKFKIAGDFQFILFERFLSYDNDLPFFEDFILDVYFLLKKLSLPAVRAFGLDNSIVNIETVPLLISQPKPITLERTFDNYEEQMKAMQEKHDSHHL